MASFKKHDTGWEYRIRVKDPYTQKFREKSQRGFASKKEAQLAAAAAEKQFAAGHVQTDDMTLSAYLDAWLTGYKAGTVRKNTLEAHRYNINSHIKPYFKSIMLRGVKPIMYQAFLNQLGENGYSRRTVEMVHSTMVNAMKKAITLGMLDRNPCTGAEMRGQKPTGKLQFIESSDLPTFLAAAQEHCEYIYWRLFKLLILTGMRKGEACALQWSDVDLDAGTISITKTFDFKDKLLGDPKTYSSIRTIGIGETLRSDLREHKERHPFDLVFCRGDGKPLASSTIADAFKRALERAGLPDMRVHSCRHTCAVLLLEAGVDTKYVQEQLGHGSIKITLDVYTHLSKKLERRSLDRFEAFVKDLL